MRKESKKITWEIALKEKMTESMVLELTEQAYIFSFPLVLMDITKAVSTNTVKPEDSRAPVNQFLHVYKLVTADFRQIVTPNVNTLYSQLFSDLKDDALVTRKPAVRRIGLQKRPVGEADRVKSKNRL